MGHVLFRIVGRIAGSNGNATSPRHIQQAGGVFDGALDQWGAPQRIVRIDETCLEIYNDDSRLFAVSD